MTNDEDFPNDGDDGPIDIKGALADAEAGAKQLAYLSAHAGDEWDRWEKVIIGLRGLWAYIKQKTGATKHTDYAARQEMSRLLSIKKFAIYGDEAKFSKQQRSAAYALMDRIDDVSDWYHGRVGYQGYPITPSDRMNWKTPQTILKYCPPELRQGGDKPKTPKASKPPRQKPVPVGVQAAINDLQRELDRLRRMVTGLIQRLAKHEPDALGLLDDIYPVKFAPPDPGTKNSGDVNSGGIGFNLSGDDDGEEA